MTCPKCNSENVNIQAVSVMKNKKKGPAYWLLVGWWLEPFMWLFLTLPWLLIKIFSPKKYKTQIRKMAICQSCGHSWNA